MSENNNYILEVLIPTRFGDPINALKLFKNYLIFGTIMGKTILYYCKNKTLSLLTDSKEDKIFDISYNPQSNSFFVCLGENQIKEYSINNPQQPIQSINIKENIQSKKDEGYILLSPDSFFRIQMPKIDEFSINLEKTEQEYDLKYFSPKDNEVKNYTGKLPMTNYFIPFDFDGQNFLWVEFLTKENRNICVANITTASDSSKIYKYDLNKNGSIGHISFAKLLPNKKVFIVHSLNICEIRLLDENFSSLERFTHIGKEVYSFEIFYEQNEENYNHRNNETVDFGYHNRNEIKNNEKEYNDNRIDIKNDDNRITNRLDNRIGNRIININTLDVDGNVNLYKEKMEINLFNMYKLNTISQEHKDKRFFSMGYAYFIKTNLIYFCISSDHGCFIIKKSNNNL